MSTDPIVSTKRAASEAPEQEQERKRARSDEGKPSPDSKPIEQDVHSTRAAEDVASEAVVPAPVSDSKELESRRKSGQVDEKQRSRRLFGSLLGTLGQGADRTVKRRQEIEDRRKAELRRQDDARAEDRSRDVAELAQKRKVDQWLVAEEDMRIRHRALRNAANFLQTRATPRLYYRPWELQRDEESKIEEQQNRAEDRIDDEVEDFELRRDKAKEEARKDDDQQAESEQQQSPQDLTRSPHAMNNGAVSPPDGTMERQQHGVDTPVDSNEVDDTESKPDETAEKQKPDQTRLEAEEARVDGEEDAVIY